MAMPKKTEWIISGVIVVVALFVFLFVFKAVKIYGDSMSPNYPNADRYIVSKLAYTTSKPKRGDVVIYDNSKLNFTAITRVVGLPNEQIQIYDGSVMINNAILAEPYLPVGTSTLPMKAANSEENYYKDDQIITLGPDDYFILGDNRPKSLDSRGFGPIKSADIKGKLLIRY